MTEHTKRRVLISGASIAGPTLAYWLHRHGSFEVTVVERSAAPRLGGYPIDVRGPAVEVIRRMGCYETVEKRRVTTRYTTFVTRRGRPFARVKPEDIVSRVNAEDVELPRGDLTDILYEHTKDLVEYVFADSIATLTEYPGHVDVTFEKGAPRSFDLVIGADGIHSRTRCLTFGPEERFIRHLGACVAIFSLPNYLRLDDEQIARTVPGKTAAFGAKSPGKPAMAFLAFTADDPRAAIGLEPSEQCRFVAQHFAGEGWEVPRLLEAMTEDPDPYFDTVSQIRMPTWSKGRVALVGDSCFAPAFLSGQGTSIALIGAYVLALELAAHADHEVAFAEYERRYRPFSEQNQALALRSGHTLLPRTPWALRSRDLTLRLLPLLKLLRLGKVIGRATKEASNSFALPDAHADDVRIPA